MDQLLKENGIHTICQEAKCPNISECFAAKTATFLILGGICTRRCSYCNVTTGTPNGVNKEEINQVTDAARALGLKFVVITSPARDDLKDGGAQQFLSPPALRRAKTTGCDRPGAGSDAGVRHPG